MWGKKVVKNTSEFFDSSSQVTKLINSVYSKFVNKIDEVFNKNELDEYEIPQVLVIGEESSGKSSLLENLIRVPIFPRNTKYCTKAPIELILRNSQIQELTCTVEHNGINSGIIPKDTITTYIENIFNQIGDNMCEEPIKVTISAPYLYDFSYIDMPGIRQYPENISIKTISLCEKYLQKENILVICVIPATQTRLTSSKALALIQKYNKTQHTILALTMVDRLQDSNIEELLIHRILDQTDELSNIKLAGCIGLFNRTHDDAKSLQMHHEEEKKWFNEVIIDCLGESPYTHLSDKIKNNLGSEKFVQCINEMFKKYICENWIPNAIKNCNVILNFIKEELDALGSDPLEIIEDDITKDIIVVFENSITEFPIIRKEIISIQKNTKKLPELCLMCGLSTKSVNHTNNNTTLKRRCNNCDIIWINPSHNNRFCNLEMDNGNTISIDCNVPYMQYYVCHENQIYLYEVHINNDDLQSPSLYGEDYIDTHVSIKKNILDAYDDISKMMITMWLNRAIYNIFDDNCDTCSDEKDSSKTQELPDCYNSSSCRIPDGYDDVKCFDDEDDKSESEYVGNESDDKSDSVEPTIDDNIINLAKYNMIRFTYLKQFLMEKLVEIYCKHKESASNMYRITVYQGVYLDTENFYEEWATVAIRYISENIVHPSRNEFIELLKTLNIRELLLESEEYVKKRINLVSRVKNIERGIEDISNIGQTEI